MPKGEPIARQAATQPPDTAPAGAAVTVMAWPSVAFACSGGRPSIAELRDRCLAHALNSRLPGSGAGRTEPGRATVLVAFRGAGPAPAGARLLPVEQDPLLLLGDVLDRELLARRTALFRATSGLPPAGYVVADGVFPLDEGPLVRLAGDETPPEEPGAVVLRELGSVDLAAVLSEARLVVSDDPELRMAAHGLGVPARGPGARAPEAPPAIARLEKELDAVAAAALRAADERAPEPRVLMAALRTSHERIARLTEAWTARDRQLVAERARFAERLAAGDGGEGRRAESDRLRAELVAGTERLAAELGRERALREAAERGHAEMHEEATRRGLLVESEKARAAASIADAGAAKADVERLARALDEEHARLEEAASTLAEQHARLEEAARTLDATAAAAEAARRALTAERARAEEVSRALEEARLETKRREDEIARERARGDELRLEATRRTEELARERARFAAEAARAAEQREAERAAHEAELGTARAAFERELSAAHAAHEAELGAARAALEGEISSAQAELASLHAAIEDARKEREGLFAELAARADFGVHIVSELVETRQRAADAERYRMELEAMRAEFVRFTNLRLFRYTASLRSAYRRVRGLLGRA